MRVSIFVLVWALWIPAALQLGQPCGLDCPDEASATCLPGCHDCACCPAVRLAISAPTLPAPILVTTRLSAETPPPPTAPEPSEIAHVPKRLTA